MGKSRDSILAIRGRFAKRKRRVRAKVFGKASRPRLSVFRSNKSLYAQIIDDETGKTLLGMSTKILNKEIKGKKTRKELAHLLGERVAVKAQSVKVKKVVFDRSGYRYHGRVKAFGEGARKGGLNF